MRAILALIVILALAAAAVFLVDNPGRVEIVWQGWQIGTSVGVLIAAAALAALSIAVVLRLVLLIAGTPRLVLRRRRERRRRAGYRALTRGMVAVAAGDAEEARRYARRAEALLAEPPLTLLLSAQAAQLGGDELAAKKFFSAMLDRPDTEFLGLRGLLNQALREGDLATARGLAERAAAMRPRTAWAALTLLDVEARTRRWEAARAALALAAKGRLIAPETARHHRAVILYELSREAAARGEQQTALRLAGEARSLAPDLAMPAVDQARLLLAQGKPKRAARILERAWRISPHPELAVAYREVAGNETALARLARFQRLAGQNPAARESHLVLAEAALAAELWGEARRHLERALTAPPPPFAPPPAAAGAVASRGPAIPGDNDWRARATPRLCLLMAQLEEAEHGDLKRIREWLDRAVHALPDPHYVCSACGAESAAWHSLCPRCGAFDRLAWRTPAWTGAAALLPVAEKPATNTLVAAAPAVLPAANPATG